MLQLLILRYLRIICSPLQAVVRCSVLQCVAVADVEIFADYLLSFTNIDMCCSALQRVAVHCRVLQCAVVCCSVLQCAAVADLEIFADYLRSYVNINKFCNIFHSGEAFLWKAWFFGCFRVLLQSVAVGCSVLRCVLQCVVVFCSVLQCVAVHCSALQCIAVRCSALQCIAVRCRVLQFYSGQAFLWRRLARSEFFACFRVLLPCVAVCCIVLQCVAV